MKLTQLKRIKLSEEVTLRLRTFKARTGLTPNIACRLALALSLAEAHAPSLELHGQEGTGQEISRETLLGDLEIPLVAMFKMWCKAYRISEEDEQPWFYAHIHRGADMLVNRVKEIGDLGNLITNA